MRKKKQMTIIIQDASYELSEIAYLIESRNIQNQTAVESVLGILRELERRVVDEGNRISGQMPLFPEAV